MPELKHLGNFAACESWAAVGMQCDDCNVSWTGCWDNFQCPICGKGELPNAKGPCRTMVCLLAKVDGIICGDDDCDLELGLRPKCPS